MAEDYFKQIRALVQKHGAGAMNDPGGVELSHPTRGHLRLSGYDTREDYEKVCAWFDERPDEGSAG
jgi:hypothetical protein